MKYYGQQVEQEPGADPSKDSNVSQAAAAGQGQPSLLVAIRKTETSTDTAGPDPQPWEKPGPMQKYNTQTFSRKIINFCFYICN